MTSRAAGKFRVAGKGGAHPFAGAEEAGLDGPHAGAGDGDDLFVLEAVDVGEEEDLALLEGEGGERLEDGGIDDAGGHLVGGVGGGVRRFDDLVVIVVAGERARGEAAATAAELIAGFIGGDAEEPTSEAAAAELGEGAVGRDEGFLGGVFGGCPVADEAEAEGEDQRLVAFDEAVERVETAVF